MRLAAPGALAVLSIGEETDLALLPTPSVRYRLRPEKPGRSASHDGLASFTVAKAGTYRVALGSGAWIDVVPWGRKTSWPRSRTAKVRPARASTR